MQPYLKIAHAVFTQNFWGTERHVAELASAQAERHDVTLFVRGDCDRDGRSILGYLSDRVRVIQIPWRLKRIAFSWHLRRLKPAILHMHLSKAAKLGRQIRIGPAKVLTLHDMELQNYAGMDAYVCVSDWQLAELPPEMRDRAQVIRNWVVPHRRLAEPKKQVLRAECGISETDYVVGFAGRLTGIKGVIPAIEGFRAASLPNSKLIVFGEGDLATWVESLDDPRIRLMGYRNNLKDYYQIMDVFLATAIAEPFGLSVLEALSANCQIVATDRAGQRDILRFQQTKFLADLGSVDSLATALTAAYEARWDDRHYDLSPFDQDARVADYERLYHGTSGTKRQLDEVGTNLVQDRQGTDVKSQSQDDPGNRSLRPERQGLSRP